MVNVCLDRLNCALENALYVGDSLVDVATARNAGAKFIACSWGFSTREKLLEAGAKNIIDKPIELLEYIK